MYRNIKIDYANNKRTASQTFLVFSGVTKTNFPVQYASFSDLEVILVQPWFRYITIHTKPMESSGLVAASIRILPLILVIPGRKKLNNGKIH